MDSSSHIYILYGHLKILPFKVTFLRKSMAFYRGLGGPEVDEEVTQIIEITLQRKNHGDKLRTLKRLATSSFLKPFSCIGILFLCWQISGFTVVVTYADDYLENIGAQALNYEMEAVLFGLVNFLLTCLAPLLLFKVSKKTLLVTCGFVGSIGFILG